MTGRPDTLEVLAAHGGLAGLLARGFAEALPAAIDGAPRLGTMSMLIGEFVRKNSNCGPPASSRMVTYATRPIIWR